MRLDLDNDASKVVIEGHTMQVCLVKDPSPWMSPQQWLALNKLAYRRMAHILLAV